LVWKWGTMLTRSCRRRQTIEKPKKLARTQKKQKPDCNPSKGEKKKDEMGASHKGSKTESGGQDIDKQEETSMYTVGTGGQTRRPKQRKKLRSDETRGEKRIDR